MAVADSAASFRALTTLELDTAIGAVNDVLATRVILRTSIGARVGTSVGALVGVRVGALVGALVGAPVGSFEGAGAISLLVACDLEAAS